jgi:hypothetical protein
MEQYKPITNYEGLYEVSNFGNVRALPRYNTDKNGKTKFYPGKDLKFDIVKKDHTSYARVTLSRDGRTKRCSVHRLVAQHFIAPATSEKDQVNHIDNNGLNNHYLNLEWVTGSENMLHSQKQGRLFKACSAGGTVSGANKRKATIEKLQQLVGTTVNNYVILSYEGLVSTNHKLKVKCTRCGEISVVSANYLRSSLKEKSKYKCSCCGNVKDENLEDWLKERNKI